MWKVRRHVEASPDRVWRLLVDLDAWPRWGLTVARAELSEAADVGPGVSGTVWTQVGVPLPFEISEFIDGHRWGWRVAGVPATKHGVEPARGGCEVWMTAPWWAAAYLPVLVIALRRIDALATSS